MLACKDGKYQVVQSVLQRPEIDINLTDNENKTCLIHGSEYNEIVNLLVTRPDVDVLFFINLLHVEHFYLFFFDSLF